MRVTVTDIHLSPQERRTAEIVGKAVRMSQDQTRRAPNFLLDYVVSLSREHGGRADQELAEAAGVTRDRLVSWLTEAERSTARRAATADAHPCIRVQAKVLRFTPIAPRNGTQI